MRHGGPVSSEAGERRVRRARDWILQGPIIAANGMATSPAGSSTDFGLKAWAARSQLVTLCEAHNLAVMRGAILPETVTTSDLDQMFA